CLECEVSVSVQVAVQIGHPPLLLHPADCQVAGHNATGIQPPESKVRCATMVCVVFGGRMPNPPNPPGAPRACGTAGGSVPECHNASGPFSYECRSGRKVVLWHAAGRGAPGTTGPAPGPLATTHT